MFSFLRRKRKEKEIEKAKNDSTSLGNILLQAGMISAEQLHEALEYQDKNKDVMLGEALIQMDVLDRGIIETLLWQQRVERGEENVVDVIQFARAHTERVMTIKDEVNVMALSLNGKKAKA